jgi:hypothetical protein
MVRFLLRDAVVLTVSLRQPPPKSPGRQGGASIAGYCLMRKFCRAEIAAMTTLRPICRREAKNPLPWMDQMPNTIKRANFFESRAEYSKASTRGGAGRAFS